jgi:tRNA threonylcarbamoyladenosine biosynthesis protein TsaE
MPANAPTPSSSNAIATVLREREVELADEAATDAFGARLASALRRGRLICEIGGIREAAAGNAAHGTIDTADTADATDATDTAGAAAGRGLQVQLSGDLGAGKTTLVRAVLRALGHVGRVRSPTYTLVEPYTLSDEDGVPLPVYHFDLYRFADPAEWADAGFREYFDGTALCFVEWPEKAGALLGVPDLALTLELHDDGRRLVARAFTQAGAQCLDRC